MQFETLPYVVANDEEKAELEATMREGNSVLKKWHLKAKRKQGERYSRMKFRKAVFDKLDPSLTVAKRVVLFGWLAIPKKDIQKILDVRAIEYRVITAFSRMVGGQALVWSRRDHDSTLQFNDLYDEGVAALIWAIYHYTRKDVRFSTYAHHTIRRRMYRKCSRTSSKSTLPHQAVTLYTEYDKARQKFNRPVSFDEIVATMDITSKQRDVLMAMMTNVVQQSALEMPTSLTDGDPTNDYSHLSCEYYGTKGDISWSVSGRHGRLGPVFTQKPTLDPDMIEAIQSANLSDFEREVLTGWLESSRSGARNKSKGNNGGGGNQGLSELAKTLINPTTGKPYSRAAVSQALGRAKEKIRAAYEDAA